MLSTQDLLRKVNRSSRPMMSIKRIIPKADLLRAIEGDSEYSVLAEGNAFVVLRWSNGKDNAVFNLVQGEITVATPSQSAMNKMNQLADKFDANIIARDENLPVQSNGDNDTDGARSTWFGWPVMVVTLLILLIWRW